MERINYEDVTLQIENYLCDVTMNSHDLTWIDYQDMKIRHDEKFGNKCHKSRDSNYFKVSKPYVHYKSGFNKCFTFDIPYTYEKTTTYFSINMKSDIFPNGIRPPRANFDVSKGTGSGFYVAFHYPQQFFHSDQTIKRTWEPVPHTLNHSHEDQNHSGQLKKNYEMRFRIGDITVLKMRPRKSWQSTAQPNCNPLWKKDDQMCMNSLMEKAECKLPYWNSTTKLNTCSSMEKIREVQPLSNANISKFYPPPCQSIKKISYDYEEVTIEDDSNTMTNTSSWFRIVLLFYEQSYKQITQVRAYDMELLIGNLGGYIGLFLGYAMLQIPDSVSIFKKWLNLNFNNVMHWISGKTKINPDMVTSKTFDDDIEPEYAINALVKGISDLNKNTNRLDNLDEKFENLSGNVKRNNDTLQTILLSLKQ
jgi:hypothetical protein